jgi:hypothetical protein
MERTHHALNPSNTTRNRTALRTMPPAAPIKQCAIDLPTEGRHVFAQAKRDDQAVAWSL